MQVQINNLAAEEVGSVELADAVFGVEVRADILHRVVLWQLAKRRAGTHKVKTRAEIARTGAKLYKQKGTGRARHGSRRVNLFRGGGVTHGPVVRDHATDLPKKVRALGLKCALSSKVGRRQARGPGSGDDGRAQDQGAGRRARASWAGARRW